MSFVATVTICGVLTSTCAVFQSTMAPHLTEEECKVEQRLMTPKVLNYLKKAYPKEQWIPATSSCVKKTPEKKKPEIAPAKPKKGSLSYAI